MNNDDVFWMISDVFWMMSDVFWMMSDVFWMISYVFGKSSALFGTYFGFGICNLKLFTSKNRLSIVPKPQNDYSMELLMILMSKLDISISQIIFFP